ncbi:hypothetical protein VTL71DRAFT_9607 [Oculimacula yallundae]|uniref:Xylanolytic transcriptional activator regulatory domain-containing protein n=1 Tax=Oculimacula yallundae TaxID=86028 RepID=A0ABR4BS57_9HELO
MTGPVLYTAVQNIICLSVYPLLAFPEDPARIHGGIRSIANVAAGAAAAASHHYRGRIAGAERPTTTCLVIEKHLNAQSARKAILCANPGSSRSMWRHSPATRQEVSLTWQGNNVLLLIYVASLKRRTEQLRNELQTKRVRIEEITSPNSVPSSSGHGRSISTVPPSLPSPATSRLGGSSNHREDADEHDVHAAMGEIGYLSLSAMAEPGDSSATHVQPLSLQTILRAAGNLRGSEPYIGCLTSESSLQVKRPMLTDFTTVTRTTTVHFVQHFLDEFCVKTPTLSQDYIMPLYDSLFSEPGSDHMIGGSIDLGQLLSYNIIAIGILHSPDSTALGSLASKLHATALDKMPLNLEKEDTVLALQFQLSLVIYSLYSSSGGSAWHFLGTAMRRLVSLGFHREPEVHDHMTAEEIDVRRWLFWSAYILDRQISSTMDRPFSIQDSDITLKEPILGQSFASPISHHVLGHARLMSRLRQPNEEDPLFNWYNLTSWHSNTPSPRSIYDQLNYHSRYLQQLACRGFVQIVDMQWLGSTPIRGINGTSLQEAVRHTLGEFIQYFHDRIEEEHFACSFIDAYDVFWIGSIYLLLSSKSQNTTASDLSDFTSKCSTILTVIAQHFRPLSTLKKALWALNGAIGSRNTFVTTATRFASKPRARPTTYLSQSSSSNSVSDWGARSQRSVCAGYSGKPPTVIFRNRLCVQESLDL